ncbi:cupin domain-containing protein [Mesorhizobium sp. M1A.F.Ca.IN.022.07.1.1]|uniref:cupin domain-containing protein n=3 Tax=Mesorhizobium TaxID=68287 RepID=UPI000F75EE0A|nr:MULTISPECIES: cupin domain-containing protein [unclassified Mesorhizobium]TGV86022.1 cupin domain-containing protein [Mesorhizobium sp. M00.F.Ca.ET.158.01.1.1]WIE93147.1 cupin domain-containing protein [Mesorhizobium sp. WSM4875]AZO60988.1 cupin domain-containing protein [Mesorhizobium sp. M1A.F.Ca.IN.022.06.1.1]MCT2576694.1 cupin domain-containing protein [Mesorhizobium sp. P13.3]MDF3165632.1 cupin domain-containing protein [Mesorhizobium sp. P16.1]
MTSAAEIIAALGLEPHPEGGWYAETFRDAEGGTRGHSTAIYFLLEQGQRSAWHRVRDAAEVWHFYAGASLALATHEEGSGTVVEHLLGAALSAGERPQIVVPAGCWQSARSLGGWTLVGCTVAPGFDFAAFELAEPDWQPKTA